MNIGISSTNMNAKNEHKLILDQSQGEPNLKILADASFDMKLVFFKNANVYLNECCKMIARLGYF